MKSWSGVGAALAAGLVVPSPAGAQAPQAQVIQVELPPAARSAAATVDAFHAALRRGNTALAASLLVDGALIFEEGAAERSKAEYAVHHLPADAAYSKAVRAVVTRRSGGGNAGLAWIATEGRSRGTFQGQPVDRITTETMLLRRVGRGWKIVHIHWSSREP